MTVQMTTKMRDTELDFTKKVARTVSGAGTHYLKADGTFSTTASEGMVLDLGEDPKTALLRMHLSNGAGGGGTPESYSIILQGAADPSFSLPDNILREDIITDPSQSGAYAGLTPRYIAGKFLEGHEDRPFCNYKLSKRSPYRYVRLVVIAAGTAPALTIDAFVTDGNRGGMG